VFLVGREVDDASGFDFDGNFTFYTRTAGTRDYVEDLPFRMSVPVRAGARLEEDAVDGHVGR
jgi:hypothetical protein